jgi:hypothetical protein
MSKYQIFDCFIILFGVMSAWACAWKAHYHFNLEEYKRCTSYCVAVIVLLAIVFVQAIHVGP